MKAKLYKLKEGYVLCSSEEIKDQDFVLTPDNKIVQAGMKEGQVGWGKNKTDFAYFGTAGSKILTQSPDFSKLKEEDAKRIGWFYVDKLAEKYYSRVIADDKHDFTRGFEIGFQKALSLTSDRRFTKEDIKPLQELVNEGYDAYDTNHHLQVQRMLEVIQKFITSISQPKSWEVTVAEENGVYKVLSVS